jgi:hypothetical protein
VVDACDEVIKVGISRKAFCAPHDLVLETFVETAKFHELSRMEFVVRTDKKSTIYFRQWIEFLHWRKCSVCQYLS